MFTRFACVLIAALLVVLSTMTVRASTPSDRAVKQASLSQSLLSNPAHTIRDKNGIVRTLTNLSVKIGGADLEQQARVFLEVNKSTFHLTNVRDVLQTSRVDRVPGGTHVRFIQTHNGIPVYGSEVVVSIDAQDRVQMVINGSHDGIDIDTAPAFTADEAVAKARRVLGVSGPAIGVPEAARLVVYPTAAGAATLAYQTTITCESPAGDWELLIDAQSGEVLSKRDRFVMDHDPVYVQGTGSVYLSDPLSASRHKYGDPGFVDNDDADSDSLRAYRTVVLLDSLTFEDGLYKLKGPSCTITNIESPLDPSEFVSATPDGFSYTRNEQGFEAVNAYYHVSNAYRRLVELGFDSDKLRTLRVDPHGFQGQDNSHYSPTGHWISFGVGGVDDAEDADVIWHEYAHAIEYTFVPGWNGPESAALAEGFADYWAASYSRSLGQWTATDEQYNWVYKWDGHNTYWRGRILNDTRVYPFGSLSNHAAGQIWSAALMGIWGDLGRDITDRLVIKSLFYLGPTVTASDFAQAILQADRDLYNGVHLATLVFWLGTVKHFIDPGIVPPAIAHVPLPNTESIVGPYTVKARLMPAWSTMPKEVFLVWGQDGVFTDSAAMTSTGEPGEFIGAISSIRKVANYSYYIVSIDSNGSRICSPTSAPAVYYSFQAGSTTTDVSTDESELPVTYSLAQNYPNPFNPTTGIRFQISSASDVRLSVYDILGREVATLVNERKESGSYEMKFDGTGLASGMYIYRLEARPSAGSTEGPFVETRKMVLSK